MWTLLILSQTLSSHVRCRLKPLAVVAVGTVAGRLESTGSYSHRSCSKLSFMVHLQNCNQISIKSGLKLCGVNGVFMMIEYKWKLCSVLSCTVMTIILSLVLHHHFLHYSFSVCCQAARICFNAKWADTVYPAFVASFVILPFWQLYCTINLSSFTP